MFKKNVKKIAHKNFYNLTGYPLIDDIKFNEYLNKGLFGKFSDHAIQFRDKGYFTLKIENEDFFQLVDDLKEELRQTKEFKNINNASPVSIRFQDAWLHKKSELVKKLAIQENILKCLEVLYGRKPFPFQTLNFPFGSKQHIHSDAVHFNSIPEGFMCGVWIALEDVHPDSGPLIYYPGSHKLPYITSKKLGLSFEEVTASKTPQKFFEKYWADSVQEKGFKKNSFLAKKGDILIWHANLIHGGEIIKNPLLTRWSQVTHYFFENCAYTTPFFNTIDNTMNSRKWRNPLNLIKV